MENGHGGASRKPVTKEGKAMAKKPPEGRTNLPTSKKLDDADRLAALESAVKRNELILKELTSCVKSIGETMEATTNSQMTLSKHVARMSDTLGIVFEKLGTLLTRLSDKNEVIH